MVERVPADELWALLLQTHQLDLDQGQNKRLVIKGSQMPIYLHGDGLEIALAIYRVGISHENTIVIPYFLAFLKI